jgi:hypothetical protein
VTILLILHVDQPAHVIHISPTIRLAIEDSQLSS